MTQLAHDCALLKIPVDFHLLYTNDDPNYELWLEQLADRVSLTRKANAKASKG